jgi:cell division initiation protein
VTLTPEEIEAKEFVVSLRGYDQADVHAFLRQVASDYRELTVEVDALRRRGGVASASIDGLMERLNAVLRTATDEATAILANAERQAAEIRDAATREALGQSGREAADAADAGDAANDVLSRARATVRQAVDRYRH